MTDPADPARRALSPAERLVCFGALATAASMLMPWYGIPFSRGLAVTGLDSFSFAAAALLITVGAAVAVVVREAAGRPPVRPLRSAELVIAAGAWAALVAGYLMVDRPDELGGSTQISLRAGVFVALAGCVVIVVAGLRMRVEQAAMSRTAG